MNSPIDPKLYEELREEMLQEATRGLRDTIGRRPNDHDAEDAMLDAFLELCEKNLNSLRSPAAEGEKIAYQRGQDRGRRVLREQEGLTDTFPDDAAPPSSPDDGD